jgi:hypothetical protein
MGKTALSKYAPLMLVPSLVLAWTSVAADPSNHPALAENSYKLTSRPWAPLKIPKKRYLDVLEGLCRFSLKFQDHTGAIIDPYTHQEEQYSTIYFAYGVGTLVHAGRAKDLLSAGVAAFEHSSLQFSQGDTALPQHDGYGAFFMPALVESLDVYASSIPKAQLEAWRSRLQLPLHELIGGRKNNWVTYAMKGEWLRATHELVSREDAQQAIEEDWRSEQGGRILATPLNLYHDKTSDPDTLSVEAVGRGNLLALIADGYDGPSAADMRLAAENGTQTTLLLQDPTGQVPANGRTSDHTWVDIGYQLAFQVVANREWAAGNKELAGDGEKAGSAMSQAYSGFVHASSPHLMELCNGPNNEFSLMGTRGTPLMISYIDDTWNYYVRGISNCGLAAADFRELAELDRMHDLAAKTDKFIRVR